MRSEYSHEAMKLRARGIAVHWLALLFLTSSPGLEPVNQSQEQEVNMCRVLPFCVRSAAKNSDFD